MSQARRLLHRLLHNGRPVANVPLSGRPAPQTPGRLRRGALLLPLLGLLLLLLAGTASAQEGGYTYTVQPGDNWPLVAQRVGLTVEQLQAANPQAVRSTGWLIVGERLTIPTAPDREEQFYIVQRGDGWTTIAEEFDLSVRLLQAVNPRALRPDEVLFVGERLLIPAPAQAPSPTPTAPPTATPTATATPTQTPTATATDTPVPTDTPTPAPTQTVPPTDTPAPTDTPVPTDTPTATPSPTVTPSPTEPPTATLTPSPTTPPTATPSPAPTASATVASLAGLPPCPETFGGLGETLALIFNTAASDRNAQVSGFLESCGVELKELVQADLTGNRSQEAVLVYAIADAERTVPTGQGELAILNGGEAYALGYTASAAGSVELLATEDINADGQKDVAWTDTTCGASTCFVTVYVRSWDGSTWRDWTKGTITMASAEVSLTSDEPGSPKEIRLTGGQYSSAGAGPQRERTEVWISSDGAPYELVGESFGTSSCLYHTVVDANRAFADGNLENAQLLYTTAIENENLEACWMRTDELAELRSFALFRLGLVAGYVGDPALAAAQVERLESDYPGQAYTAVARRWLDAYAQSGDPKAACLEVNESASGEAVAVLADYGYANPTFTAEDICPVLALEAPVVAPQAAASQEETPTPAPTAAASPSPAPPPSASPTATSEPAERESVESAAAQALAEELPECPVASVDYIAALPVAVELAAGDPLIIEAWLRVCNGLTDERGGLIFYDLNDDGLDDIIAMPTILSDAGYGPDGADGTLVILHQQADGSYQTAYDPDIYGQPKPLAVGDANDDGQPELIWQLDSCSTFCVSSVQAIVWDESAGAYRDAIEPGAAIAEGTVIVEVADLEEPTGARRLRLIGGVSGTGAGGLSVPHTEIWHSYDGAPFRRFSWTYDRESEGSDCLGLRLVEADVALQAADVQGYGPAIELYTAALEDPQLQACSIYGTDPAEEIALLQGLASFRLVQALALSGNSTDAESMLATLASGQPDGKFTEAATGWLDAFNSDGDGMAACEAVTPIFENNPKLWQITDQFGYDHPALAAQQICYVPSAG